LADTRRRANCGTKIVSFLEQTVVFTNSRDVVDDCRLCMWMWMWMDGLRNHSFCHSERQLWSIESIARSKKCHVVNRQPSHHAQRSHHHHMLLSHNGPQWLCGRTTRSVHKSATVVLLLGVLYSGTICESYQSVGVCSNRTVKYPPPIGFLWECL
jgi:hypothetical protein